MPHKKDEPASQVKRTQGPSVVQRGSFSGVSGPPQPRSGIRPARRQGGYPCRMIYKTPHPFYCGVDLHARSMFVHILDHAGKTVFEARSARRARRLPRRHQAVSARASSSAASACSPGTGSPTSAKTRRIPFVLGHALAMKAIHGGKAKNDKHRRRQTSPACSAAACFPLAYVYPQGQARHPRPAAAPLLLRPPTRPTDRPHLEHQQPVQPAAVRPRS